MAETPRRAPAKVCRWICLRSRAKTHKGHFQGSPTTPTVKNTAGQNVQWDKMPNDKMSNGLNVEWDNMSIRLNVESKCIAGNCIGYIRLPQSQKQCIYLSKVYCYFMWERKFLAVRWVGLMTHREYRVHRPFPVT
jgi:hypothetical protein